MLPIGSHIGHSLDQVTRCRLPIVQMMFSSIPEEGQIAQIRRQLGLKSTQLVIHAPYEINLAQPPDSPIGRKSAKMLKEQIAMTSRMTPEGMTGFLVFHVGKSLKLSVEQAELSFYDALETALETTPDNVTVLLETPAGQGTEMFTEFDDFFAVYRKFQKYNFGLCVDTCHISSAGQSIREFFGHPELAQKTSPVCLIHLNDSHTPRGSGVDRHANLGTGHLFGRQYGGSLELLEWLVKWAVKYNIPIILETGSAAHQDELNMLYSMAYPDRRINVEKWCGDEELEESETLVDGDTDAELVESDDEITVEPRVSVRDKIVAILTTLADASENQFRKTALKKAADIISQLDFEITSASQVKKYEGIGKGIADKITEIIETGTLAEYEAQREKFDAIRELTSINGIGPVTAKRYFAQGIKTVGELAEAHRKGEVKLTKAQVAGLKFHFDIQQRIPRAEIHQFDSLFGELTASIDPKLQHTIVGSYRRGKPDSGDIDVLFMHPDLTTPREVHASSFLDEMLEAMQAKKMVDSVLSHGKNKIMMIAHLPPKKGGREPVSRRVDFLLTPRESHGAATMYFTGSKEFNVMCRNRAIRLGYKLNEYGLYDRDGEQIPTSDENSIFEHLQLEYLDPTEREIQKRDRKASPRFRATPRLKAEVKRTRELEQSQREREQQELERRLLEEVIEEPTEPDHSGLIRQLTAMGRENLATVLDLSLKGDPVRKVLVDRTREILADIDNCLDRKQLIEQALSES